MPAYFFILVYTCTSTYLISCSIFSALAVHGLKVGSPVCRVGFGPTTVELEHPRKDNTAQLLLNNFALKQWDYLCIAFGNNGRLTIGSTLFAYIQVGDVTKSLKLSTGSSK